MQILHNKSNSLLESLNHFSEQLTKMQANQSGTAQPGLDRVLSVIGESQELLNSLSKSAETRSAETSGDRKLSKESIKNVLLPVFKAIMAADSAAKDAESKHEGTQPKNLMKAFFLEMTKANTREQTFVDDLARRLENLSLEDMSGRFDAFDDYKIDLFDDAEKLLRVIEEMVHAQQKGRAQHGDVDKGKEPPTLGQ